MHMKIVLPGGSGQIGMILARSFQADGHEVVILSRTPRPSAFRVVPWDARNLGPWADEIDGADVVINLAGRSVNCRYNAANRREIIDSRVYSTAVVGRAIAQAARPPRVWLQSSTATIYSHRYDAANDEVSGILGGTEPNSPDTWRFSIDVAKAWEQATNDSVVPNTRKVLLRSAMTMSPDADGVYEVLLGLVRRGLGGTNGDGRQFVSWIHEVDFVRAVDWIITHDQMEGAINLASPNPVPNAEFMRTLRHAVGAWGGLPASRWMLELGALFLRTETELILKSRRVTPTRLIESGFVFQFPDWSGAAADLYFRWRASNCSAAKPAKAGTSSLDG
jgi:uncharacterized protein (TIGR01777 family)